MKFTLDGLSVLKAVKSSHHPQSIYIGDVIQRNHTAHISSGGTGHCPTSKQIKRALDKLQHDGFLTRSRYPNGYYGYSWTITAPGEDALGGNQP